MPAVNTQYRHPQPSRCAAQPVGQGSFAHRPLAAGLALALAAALSGCGGGGGGGGAAPAPVTPAATLATAKALNVSSPVARDSTLPLTFTKSGNTGTVTATVSANTCDGASMPLVPKVTDGTTTGTVELQHTGVLLPAGGECAFTVKVDGSLGGTDTRTYGVVVDSRDTDRVVIMAASTGHSPVVYVRQDDNSFRKHVPVRDFAWNAGNCMIERNPASLLYRAVACYRMGTTDTAPVLLVLSAVDWTLSESKSETDKLGATKPFTDLTYWMGVNDIVANPTPEVGMVSMSRGGKFTLGNVGNVNFTTTDEKTVTVAPVSVIGTTKVFTAW